MRSRFRTGEHPQGAGVPHDSGESGGLRPCELRASGERDASGRGGGFRRAVRSQLRRPGASDLRGCAARAVRCRSRNAPPAARGGDMPGRAENPSDGRKRAAGRICGRRNPARAIGKAAPRMNSPTLPGRAENPSDGRKRAADRICGRRNPARAVGKAVPPDEFSDIRRRRERRRCVPAKPTGQAPRGRFVAGAGMPPAARGGDMPGRAESPSGARKRAAGREHSTAERISGRRNPARAIGKAAPRMNFPTSGEGGREDDASRQSRPDKLRTGGSLPEPDIAGACRKSVGRAKEGRGPHLRTPQSRTGGRKGGAPDEFSDIRRRRERRRCVPAKPTGQAPRGQRTGGLECKL